MPCPAVRRGRYKPEVGRKRKAHNLRLITLSASIRYTATSLKLLDYCRYKVRNM